MFEKLRLPRQQQYTVLSFLQCKGMASHKLTSSRGLRITLWAYLSVDLVQDSHKRLSSTEKTTIPRAPSHVITHYHYVCVTERYTETLYMKKMADLVAVYKFI